jgi:serine/threonine-protein kinase
VPAPGCDPSRVKLIDFGLAQSIREDGPGAVPIGDGAFNGSPLYAPPESYSGTIDHRSDIYSLGATAYYLLTGRPVFDECRPLAAIMAHVVREPMSVLSVCRSTDPVLNGIVMKCLQKDPQDRFQSVDELDAALAAVGE